MIRCLPFLLFMGLCIGSMNLLYEPVSSSSAAAAPPQASSANDWPLYGGTPARNLVNLTAKNIPTDWSIEAGKEKNVKWQAALGTKTYGGPVVAGGRVFVGTNNLNPRDPKLKGNRSVLMCFDEKSGKFLWQNTHEAADGPVYNDVRDYGLLSTPVVDGERIYFVLPQSIVVCVDVKNGKTLWQYDMFKKLKVVPFHCSNCSPLIHGNLLFLLTGKGVDPDTDTVRDDNSPSFVAIDKNTGELAWQKDYPGKRVIQGQWSNPACAVIKGKAQVIFPGGDAALYGLEPETGNLIWEFHCYPKNAARDDKEKNYIVATPVIHDNKVWVGLGVAPELGNVPRHSYFLCIDATRTGDVSPSSLDPKAVQPRSSALLWSFGGPIEPAPKSGKAVHLKSTISTCAIHDGLVYLPETTGFLHCLDAATGKEVWQFDLQDTIWGSPLYVDGKVYVNVEAGEVAVLEAGRKMKLIAKVDMEPTMHGTPVVANGVLYLATSSKLFAIAAK
jgi:outer membrane protein assembly factor BamB